MKKFAEFHILIAGLARERGLQPSPYHREATQNIRFSIQPVDRTGDDEEEPSTHEILAIAVAHTPGINVFLAGPLRPKMDETQFRFVPATGDPTIHAAAMTVDSVPHHLAHKAANRLETRHSVEFRRAD